MAFFNFRLPGTKGRDDKAPAVSSDSVEVMRRRARHRLIGATVLVAIGVVVFPLLFDTQPRPIPVDIPITIPDRNKVAPLPVPGSSPSATASGAVSSVAPPPAARGAGPASGEAAKPSTRVADAAGLDAGEEVISTGSAKPDRKPESKPAAAAVLAAASAPKPEPKPEPKKESKAEHKAKPAPVEAAKPAARPDDAARAKALLEGKTVESAEADARIVVQVGAFADADKAREARLKLEHAGLKTYTHVTDTKDGKRTRVRVGPFATRAEAERAAQKVKKLDLPASILTL